MRYASLLNLIPLTERSEDEAREIRRRGGIASARERERKDIMYKTLQAYIDFENDMDKIRELNNYRIDEFLNSRNYSVQELHTIAQQIKRIFSDDIFKIGYSRSHI